jgi:cytochrome c biogenesis protein CcmG/thiol:disulfide interchange protein DsbE
VAALLVAAAAAVLAQDLGRDRVTVTGSPLLDQPAPDLQLETLDGHRVRLADLRGQPVIVNFWASWCEPCKEEFPLFRDAYAEHADEGLEILGVIHDDFAPSARDFARSQGATWPLLLDPDDAAYRVLGLPSTYYIDREGIVRAVAFGPPSSGSLELQLRKVL